MHKLHDVVITPHGLAKIDKVNRNGVCRLTLISQPNQSFFMRKRALNKLPLADRAPTDHTGIESPRSQTPIYRAWRTMLRKPVQICDEWREFAVFSAWYKSQIAGRPGGVKWVVDTLIAPGNSTYGPETCCVVPQPVSTAFKFRKVKRDLPLGVVQVEGMFQAHCGNRLIGQYQSVDEAAAAYWRAKMVSIRDLAVRYWNHLPEALAMRLVSFDWPDAAAYFPEEFADDA